MVPATTVLLNGVTAAIADISLNDLSRRQDFAHLQAYFRKRSILKAALTAAVTVMIGATAVLLASRLLFGFDVPSTVAQGLATLCLSFGVGWAMDVLIRRWDVFPTLATYYRTYGAGLWGALSLTVSMIVALLVQAFVLPVL